MDKIKLLQLIKLCEYYFYHYLITEDKRYIDKFFQHSRRLKKEVGKWYQTASIPQLDLTTNRGTLCP